MPTQLEIRTLVRCALSKSFVRIALILISGVISYSNTFHVPFFFDDNRFIVDNQLIKSLNNFWSPTGNRWFGSLTLALNFAADGLNVTGYHFVNLLIHLITALMVSQLVNTTFQAPLIHSDNTINSEQTKAAHLAGLITGLLFVSHPIQTQAVTYIVQRFASLATLLFVASLLCYAKARLAGITSDKSCRPGTLSWYGVSLVSAVLAMKTKEIAFTLPFVLTIYEFAFFPRRRLMERTFFLIPVVLTLFIIPYTLLGTEMGNLSSATLAGDISRHDYLLTQFRVIVTYLRLLVLPVNQMFDYGYPVFHSVLNPSVYLSLTLLAVLFISSTSLLIKGGRGTLSPIWRVVGFGGLWFFITLTVESSIIPITDVIFEHRLYLPSIGFFIAVTVAFTSIFGRLEDSFPKTINAGVAVVLLLLIALPVATHSRNHVWRSERDIWEDAVSKNPNNARAQAMIAIMLIESGNIDQGIDRLLTAISIKPDYADAYICLGSAYNEKGQSEEGYRQFLKALELGTMDFESRAQLLKNIGNYNLRKGLPDSAIHYYQSAISLTPNIADIHFNLGLAYKAKGQNAEAAVEFTKALELNPNLVIR